MLDGKMLMGLLLGIERVLLVGNVPMALAGLELAINHLGDAVVTTKMLERINARIAELQADAEPAQTD